MRANDQPTWKALAEPLVLIGGLLGMVPFMVLLIGPPPEAINRTAVWTIFALWALAQVTISSWALMTERPRRSVAPPPPPRRRKGIIDLAERRRDRARVKERLDRLRGRTTA